MDGIPGLNEFNSNCFIIDRVNDNAVAFPPFRLIADKWLAYQDFKKDPEKALEDIKHPTAAYALVRDWSFISDRIDDTSAATSMYQQAMFTTTQCSS